MYPRMIMLRHGLVGGILCLLALIPLAGCNEIEIASVWRSRPVTIDGSDTDWADMLLYFKESNISLGVCNDEQNVYFCLITTDPSIEHQMIGSGLTVWLDSTGGNDKSFGIHYPLGFQATWDRSAQRGAEEDDPEQSQAIFQRLTAELEVVGQKEAERVRMAAPGSGGILVQLNRSNGRLVYEMKVPIARSGDEKYLVSAAPGKSIGLGLEVSQPPERRAMGEGTNDAGRGRGRGRRFGGEAGGEEEGTRPQGRATAKPLDLWLKVDLATRPPTPG